MRGCYGGYLGGCWSLDYSSHELNQEGILGSAKCALIKEKV